MIMTANTPGTTPRLTHFLVIPGDPNEWLFSPTGVNLTDLPRKNLRWEDIISDLSMSRAKVKFCLASLLTDLVMSCCNHFEWWKVTPNTVWVNRIDNLNDILCLMTCCRLCLRGWYAVEHSRKLHQEPVSMKTSETEGQWYTAHLLVLAWLYFLSDMRTTVYAKETCLWSLKSDSRYYDILKMGEFSIQLSAAIHSI